MHEVAILFSPKVSQQLSDNVAVDVADERMANGGFGGAAISRDRRTHYEKRLDLTPIGND